VIELGGPLSDKPILADDPYRVLEYEAAVVNQFFGFRVMLNRSLLTIIACYRRS